MSKISKERRESRLVRHNRVRKKIHGTAERPRLSLYRSNKQIEPDGMTLFIDSPTTLHAKYESLPK